ncbi:MAG: T9SS type A sorting domain-containing protein [Ignavibacteriales bacterium]|nr:T9SS type A sorting domain-containing protein [Ignavibacteriales bacterium]
MTPHILDLPPFVWMGSANSFFDVFFELNAGGTVLHNSIAKHINATITHKPPAIGEEYADDTPVDLVDEDEQQTGIRILKTIHIPDPGEIDYFTHVKSLIELHYPDQSTEIIKLRGKSLEHVVIPPGGSADDSDGDGLDDVETEMLQLELIGSSTIYGDVKVRLRDYTKRPWQHTLGEIEELINATPGTLDLPPFTVSGIAQSFFDVFLEINLGGIILNNMDPKRIQEIITHKPPAEDETYEGTTLVTLFDTEGMPSGIQLGLTTYTPNPGADTIETQVAQGWNMVSIPVTLDNFLKTVVYPTAISNAFAYEGGTYKTKDTLDNGPGYWVKFSSSQTIDYIGDWRALDTIDIAEGWNMIGSISDTVDVSEILSIPSGIITSQFFGYDKGYVSSDIIAPGKAYWVKVTNPFNPTTVISYQLPVYSWVTLKVYNIFGQEVKTIVNEQQSAGFKSIKFNTIGLASGVYYYKLTAGSFTEVRQTILMK